MKKYERNGQNIKQLGAGGGGALLINTWVNAPVNPGCYAIDRIIAEANWAAEHREKFDQMVAAIKAHRWGRLAHSSEFGRPTKYTGKNGQCVADEHQALSDALPDEPEPAPAVTLSSDKLAGLAEEIKRFIEGRWTASESRRIAAIVDAFVAYTKEADR